MFPIKFKFEMTLLPEPAPVALGFAGGIEIRNAASPALSAYTQVD